MKFDNFKLVVPENSLFIKGNEEELNIALESLNALVDICKPNPEKINNMNEFRKDGFYNVKYKGEWVLAKWVTNQDIDSYWCCWWIEGVEPKAWGWCDKDFDEINEEKIIK